MKTEEMKQMSKTELLNLLEANTKEFHVKDDILIAGYGIVLDEFLQSDNYITEEKVLWGVILGGFFSFEVEVIEVLYDKIGTYELMGWCHDNLMDRTMIKNYYNKYMRFHKEKTSASEVLNTFISAFVDDLGTMQPESLIDYAKDLGKELNKLPSLVKEQIK